MELELVDSGWQTDNESFEFNGYGFGIGKTKYAQRLSFIANEPRFYPKLEDAWTGLVGFAAMQRITWEVEDGA